MKARLLRARLALALIGLPMLVGTLYFAHLASDRFVSTAVLTVRHAGPDTPAASGLSLLLSAGSARSQEDTRYLQHYLHSLALLETLQQRLSLRQHYTTAGTGHDLWYRLPAQASQEDWLDYWRERVEVSLEDASGLLTVRVQGFSPEVAQRTNQALLQEAEAFVNAISHRIAAEQLTFARGELDRAAEQLGAAERALVAFQTRHQRLDPGADAQATSTRTSALRERLARLEAELSTKQTFLHDDAPDLVTLKAELAAVRLQVEREGRSATGASSAAAPLQQLAVEFHALKSRVALAESAHRSALASVETTRIEASRKLKSLVVIEPPTRPDTAEYPRRLYGLATLLMVCVMAWGIARMTLTTVREHQD